VTPEELWASKFAHRFAEERAREEARREQAFLDLPIIIGGEEVRAMTPRDLLLLNGAECPFVCGGADSPEQVALFIWALHVENDGSLGWLNRRRRYKMIRRLAPQNYDELVRACNAYVDEIFQDAPGGSGAGDSPQERRPLGTCFLAPLVVNLAVETGWSQHEILGTPLPRMFQYYKAIRAREQGKKFIDSSPSDRLTSEFLAELNKQSA
jgi:hypothetical protein